MTHFRWPVRLRFSVLLIFYRIFVRPSVSLPISVLIINLAPLSLCQCILSLVFSSGKRKAMLLVTGKEASCNPEASSSLSKATVYYECVLCLPHRVAVLLSGCFFACLYTCLLSFCFRVPSCCPSVSQFDCFFLFFLYSWSSCILPIFFLSRLPFNFFCRVCRWNRYLSHRRTYHIAVCSLS